MLEQFIADKDKASQLSLQEQREKANDREKQIYAQVE